MNKNKGGQAPEMFVILNRLVWVKKVMYEQRPEGGSGMMSHVGISGKKEGAVTVKVLECGHILCV